MPVAKSWVLCVEFYMSVPVNDVAALVYVKAAATDLMFKYHTWTALRSLKCCKVRLQANVLLTEFEKKVLDEFQAEIHRQHEKKWSDDMVWVVGQDFKVAAT